MPAEANILGDYGETLNEIAPELTGAMTDEIEESLRRLVPYALHMVRYAASQNPRDSVAEDISDNSVLINPITGEPFTLEDLEIDRARASGTTTGPFGRENVVGEVTVALYRALSNRQ